MKTTINITILTDDCSASGAIEDMLNIGNYVSAQLRACLNIQVGCSEYCTIGTFPTRVFIDGQELKPANMSSLIDALHFLMASAA